MVKKYNFIIRRGGFSLANGEIDFTFKSNQFSNCSYIRALYRRFIFYIRIYIKEYAISPEALEAKFCKLEA